MAGAHRQLVLQMVIRVMVVHNSLLRGKTFSVQNPELGADAPMRGLQLDV